MYGFEQSAHDHCLFILTAKSSFLALLVYVDNILIIEDSEDEIKKVKKFLDQKFTIKVLEYAKYFLGLELSRSELGIYVNQRKYTLDLIQDAGLFGCKPISTLLPKGTKFCSNEGELMTEPQKYRRLIGRLLYLGFTRLDIAFVTQQLSQYVQAPRETHWLGALHLLRYVKGSPSLGLCFSSKNSLQLTTYSDSDWGSCIDTRRCLTSYCIFLGGALISWKTKKSHNFEVMLNTGR